MQFRRVSLAGMFLVFLVGLGARPVYAQAIHEGKVTGTVKSEDGAALPGATVVISSPALLAGTRTTTTSERGSYVFLNLPVGRYRLTVSRDAFKTVAQEGIDVSPAAVVTIDMVLPVGTVQEQVTVSAEGPIVDTKTSTIDSRIDRNLLDKLPTSRDAFYDLALSTPGMFTGSGAPTQTTEFQSPTAYGSATNENVFLINGVDATSPRAGSFGSLVNVNYDAVEEVRIVALGSKAEYGSYSGAAIDVLTKSGSNDFHGSGAFYSKLGSVADNQPAPGENFGSDFLYVGEGDTPPATSRRTGRSPPRWAARSSRTSSGSSAPSTTSAAPACRRCRRSRASPGAAMPTSSSRPRPSRATAPSSPTTTRTTTATAGAGAPRRDGTPR